MPDFEKLFTIDGVAHKIFYSLDSKKDQKELGIQNKLIYNFFKSELETIAAKQLLQYIVYGDEASAKKMLQANPSLLLVKSKVSDYSGRIIVGTAFQAALGAVDSLMWEMMEPYFKRLEEQGSIESAHETMKHQFDEQFPDGLRDEQAQKEHAEIKHYYVTLAQNIANAANDAAKNQIIETFRLAVDSTGKKIDSGKHFNMQHLEAAFDAYISQYEALEISRSQDMFWQKIIGFIQRQIPAHFAQAYCSGLKNLDDNADKLKRTLSLLDDTYFFPVKASSGVGFDFAIFSWRRTGLRAIGRSCISEEAAAATSRRLKQIVKQKQARLLDLDLSLKRKPNEQPYYVTI